MTPTPTHDAVPDDVRALAEAKVTEGWRRLALDRGMFTSAQAEEIAIAAVLADRATRPSPIAEDAPADPATHRPTIARPGYEGEEMWRLFEGLMTADDVSFNYGGGWRAVFHFDGQTEGEWRAKLLDFHADRVRLRTSHQSGEKP